MATAEKDLPDDVAADLADLRRAIQGGEATEEKQPGQPRTVQGPRGLRWFPLATERGHTLRSVLIGSAWSLSILGILLTILSFVHGTDDKAVVMAATIALLLSATTMSVIEARQDNRARSEVALGTFLLSDALVVIDRGRCWSLRRSEIRRVAHIRHSQTAERYIRMLSVQYSTPKGLRWLRIGWRNHPGAQALVESWIEGKAP